MTNIDVCVYVATKMTGRDQKEMIQRAEHVCRTLKEKGISPVSPVIEEKIEDKVGPLVQVSSARLKQFWKRDKDIIANMAHVVLIDEAERKSIGVEREYGYSRYCLWKPTISLLPSDTGHNVAFFEDDVVVHNIEDAANIIVKLWGTRQKRWKWRLNMLMKSFPKWLLLQLKAWR